MIEPNVTELELVAAVVADVRAAHEGEVNFDAQTVLEMMVRAARLERETCAGFVELATRQTSPANLHYAPTHAALGKIRRRSPL